MAQGIKQYYDIKFPFTSDNMDGFFIDLNENLSDKVLSEILHVILTPKETRLRMPDFGTDLVKYIFELNDKDAWNGIRQEIIANVTRYVPDAVLNDIKVLQKEDDEHLILLEIDYSVKTGISQENKKVVVKL